MVTCESWTLEKGASKRGGSPSFSFFPLSFEGEGDTGGEVAINY